MTGGCCSRFFTGCLIGALSCQKKYGSNETDGEDVEQFSPVSRSSSPEIEATSQRVDTENYHGHLQPPPVSLLNKCAVAVGRMIGAYQNKILAGILAAVAAALMISGVGAIPVIAVAVSAGIVFLASTLCSAARLPSEDSLLWHIVESLGWAAAGVLAVAALLALDKLLNAAGGLGGACGTHGSFVGFN